MRNVSEQLILIDIHLLQFIFIDIALCNIGKGQQIKGLAIITICGRYNSKILCIFQIILAFFYLIQFFISVSSYEIFLKFVIKFYIIFVIFIIIYIIIIYIIIIIIIIIIIFIIFLIIIIYFIIITIIIIIIITLFIIIIRLV